MNYMQARQRKDGRWDYTNRNDGLIYPIGYCAKWTPFTADFQSTFAAVWQRYQEQRDRYHADGHATEDEAYACYTRYCLEQKLRLHDNLYREMRPCDECGTYTSGIASVDSRSWVLCDEHRTVETVTRLFGSAGRIISS